MRQDDRLLLLEQATDELMKALDAEAAVRRIAIRRALSLVAMLAASEIRTASLEELMARQRKLKL